MRGIAITHPNKVSGVNMSLHQLENRMATKYKWKRLLIRAHWATVGSCVINCYDEPDGKTGSGKLSNLNQGVLALIYQKFNVIMHCH